MPSSPFTVIIIGAADDVRHQPLAQCLHQRTAVLANAGERLDVLAHDQLDLLPERSPCAAVVLCRKGMAEAENKAIAECQKRKFPILPVVADLKTFGTLAPEALAAYNGFELRDNSEIGELAGLVLESLGLQRSRRKIFISYARADASAIARQLRDAFMARWYTVFLDTVSIRPGALFEDELLQELADSDVLLLLNSPTINKRPYVQKEIAFADQAGIGGVQVVWPKVEPLREGAFFMPVHLDGKQAGSDARVEELPAADVTKILRTVADLRTALQAQREEQLRRPVEAYAQARDWTAVSYLGRYIELRNDEDCIRLDVAHGVPTSLDLERAWKTAAEHGGAGKLVYDPLGITNRYADHMGFLGTRLALQFLDYRTALQWTLIP